jgi:hypothetical protein
MLLFLPITFLETTTTCPSGPSSKLPLSGQSWPGPSLG